MLATVAKKILPTDKKITFKTSELKYNEITRAAIEEGRKIIDDPNVKSYKTMSELKAALEE